MKTATFAPTSPHRRADRLSKRAVRRTAARAALLTGLGLAALTPSFARAEPPGPAPVPAPPLGCPPAAAGSAPAPGCPQPAAPPNGVWAAPQPIDPVTAAYLDEYDKEQGERARSKARRADPPELVNNAEYQRLKGQRNAGIVMLSVGGMGVLVGAVWLISASLRHWDLFKGSEPDRSGQAGAGVMMGLSASTMVAGGVLLGVSRSGMKEMRERYFTVGQGLSFDVHVGLGSAGISGSF
ncbi:MAG: hypothetical protein R3B70_01155 [Polyangiaceae bacterium]